MAEPATVFVETSARLHFGVLDLSRSLGRWFGGVGAAAAAPTLRVSVRRADRLEVEGEDGERAAHFARRFLDRYQIAGGAQVRVHRALPPHAGLGSGTQLGLAVARALADLYGIHVDAPALASAIGRGHRSAIGTWTFEHGGLVVEGGRREDVAGLAPLIARVRMPSAWRVVVAVPRTAAPVSGEDEAAAFGCLERPPREEAERVAHLVLMALLPAAADADLSTFGRALTDIQAITGGWFAAAQGGTFARGASTDLVRRMAEWGACGLGQSSWGPTVYGIVEGDAACERLLTRVRQWLGSDGAVYAGPFRATGARVWRADPTTSSA
jgi:beta-RFAP synthase